MYSRMPSRETWHIAKWTFHQTLSGRQFANPAKSGKRLQGILEQSGLQHQKYVLATMERKRVVQEVPLVYTRAKWHTAAKVRVRNHGRKGVV